MAGFGAALTVALAAAVVALVARWLPLATMTLGNLAALWQSDVRRLLYALANLAAFGVVVELRGRREITSYGGLASTRPVLAVVLAVAFLSFVGVPPLAGFTAKLTLFSATIDAGYTWLAVLAVLNTVVSLAYYLRVLAPAFFEPLSSPIPVLGRWAAGATIACGALVVVAGILAEPLLGRFEISRLMPG